MFLFTDVETGGLDENNHLLLEIFAIKLDSNFEPIKEPFHVVIKPPGTTYDARRPFDRGPKHINDYCYEMHSKNNLVNEAMEGTPFEVVNDKFQDYLQNESDLILGGSSVHFDRRFLLHNFPWLNSILHYRMMDVRALQLCYDLKIDLPYAKDKHRAEPDCRNAIHTAKHYRTVLRGTVPDNGYEFL